MAVGNVKVKSKGEAEEPIGYRKARTTITYAVQEIKKLEGNSYNRNMGGH